MPSRASRIDPRSWACVALIAAGCNALLGIDDHQLLVPEGGDASADAASENGGSAGAGGAGGGGGPARSGGGWGGGGRTGPGGGGGSAARWGVRARALRRS